MICCPDKKTIPNKPAKANEEIDNQKLQEYCHTIFDNSLAGFFIDYNNINFADILDIKWADNYQNLANGDCVTLQIGLKDTFVSAGATMKSLEKARGISIKNTELTFTVKDLPEPQVLDIMSLLGGCIHYSGGNGNGKAAIAIPADFSGSLGEIYLRRSDFSTSTIDIINDNKVIASMLLSVDNCEGLSTNDIVTIKGKILGGDELMDLSYVVDPQERSFAVPELGEYISSSSQIDENFLSEIKTAGSTATSLWLDDVTVDSVYLGTIAPNGVTYDYSKCIVCIIFYGKETWPYSGTGYKGVVLRDVVLKTDGTIEYGTAELVNNILAGFDTANEVLESFPLNYAYERIG